MDEQNTGTGPGHMPGTLKGEDRVKDMGKEEGRDETADSLGIGETELVTTRKASDTTGINADTTAPIDPAMPDMPPA